MRLGLVLAIVLVLLLRERGLVLWPILYAEDGREMFAFYYADPDPARVLRCYSGYVALAPNLIGYLSCRLLPTTWIPYGLAVVPFAISVATFALFASPRFAHIVPDVRHRVVLCLLLVLLPIGNFALLGNTTYSQNNLLVLLALLSIARLPAHTTALAAWVFLMCLLVCSHPLSIVLVPVWLVHAAVNRRPGALLFHALLVAIAIAYQVLAVQHQSAAIEQMWQACRDSPGWVLDRVVFEATFGTKLRIELHGAGHGAIVYAVSIILLAALLVLVVHSWRSGAHARRAFFALCAYLIAATTVLTLTARGTAIHFEWGHRYWYVQKVCFLLAGGLALLTTPMSRRLRVTLVLVGAVHLFVTHRASKWYYDVSKDEGATVRRFVQSVADQEQRLGSRSLVRARLERAEWSIVIEPPQAQAPGTRDR